MRNANYGFEAIKNRYKILGGTPKEIHDDFKYMSTLRKVDMISSILNQLSRGDLKVRSTLKDIYGLSLPGIFEIIKNSWFLLLLMSIAGYIIGAASEPVIQRFSEHLD